MYVLVVIHSCWMQYKRRCLISWLCTECLLSGGLSWDPLDLELESTWIPWGQAPGMPSSGGTNGRLSLSSKPCFGQSLVHLGVVVVGGCGVRLKVGLVVVMWVCHGKIVSCHKWFVYIVLKNRVSCVCRTETVFYTHFWETISPLTSVIPLTEAQKEVCERKKDSFALW